MLAWLIIGIGFAAAWHAIYELILLPSLQRDAQFKLFELRDRLRTLKADNPEQCEDEAFHLLDESLSWRMDNIAAIRFSFLENTMKVIAANADIREEVARRLRAFESCKLPDYVSIRMESNKLTVAILGMNSGGWLIYLLPILYIWTGIDKTRKEARRLNAMPESELPGLDACAA